ncbi:MAG: class I SAM-dependent methyltransferase [Chitinophagaceae bacterium]
MNTAEKNIADYYNQTIDHYTIWWKLNKNKAVHFGYWDEYTKTFADALHNTNIQMAKRAHIQHKSHVLDAGCGVGGSAFYLANEFNCSIKGVSLSEKQLAIANSFLDTFKKKDAIQFSLQNFNHTDFISETFDVIWACESSCHASPKTDFIKEAYRLLKKGGRLVVADYFLTPKGLLDEKQYMKNWGDLWAIEEFHSEENFINILLQSGFELIENDNVSEHVMPSARKMYYAYLWGAIPSKLYNLFHNTSRYGKKHYQSGYFQYRSLQEKYWEYRIVVAVKK